MKTVQIVTLALMVALPSIHVASANSTGLHNPTGAGAGCITPSWVKRAFFQSGSGLPCIDTHDK